MKLTKAEHGRHIISAAKALKSFRRDDHQIAAFLHATWNAGRAGLLLSALRGAQASGARFAMLASSEGFSTLELRDSILPRLEQRGLVAVKRKGDEIESVECLALTYSLLMSGVSDLYGTLTPTEEDRGCITIVAMASGIPCLESEVLEAVAREIGEEKAKIALGISKNYRLISNRSGKGLREPILFSERVWSANIGDAGKLLTTLTRDQRAAILSFVEKVKTYQGYPEELLRAEARAMGSEHLLELALGVGLITRTKLQAGAGEYRYFLMSPHFYNEMKMEFGEDTCDRVKIFLDGIRNGQHYGHTYTGRIADPDALLTKLLNSGTIGPCTAIGTDYIISEKAGIVKVRRELGLGSKCYMEPIQIDVVKKVHQLITTGSIEEGKRLVMLDNHVSDGRMFHSTEQVRIEAGDVPAPVAEAERAIMLKLREG